MMKSLLEDDVCMPQCLPPSFFDFLADPHRSVPVDVHHALDALSHFDDQKAKSLTNLMRGVVAGDSGCSKLEVCDIFAERHEENHELLTAANIGEYIREEVEHVLVGSRRRELDEVRCGFLAAVSGLAKHLDLFHGVELMQVLCGMPHLDAETLLGEISFDDRVSPQTEAYMRKFVTGADERTLKNLLAFVTSISVMPRQGLRQNIRATQLKCGGLRQSHTCFYELELPECSSYDEFERKAVTSLDNGSIGFGQQ